jgi:hypothetical protein
MFQTRIDIPGKLAGYDAARAGSERLKQSAK